MNSSNDRSGKKGLHVPEAHEEFAMKGKGVNIRPVSYIIDVLMALVAAGLVYFVLQWNIKAAVAIVVFFFVFTCLWFQRRLKILEYYVDMLIRRQ